MRPWTVRAALCLVVAVLFAGCDTLTYYGQAASGQLGLLTQRRRIDALLDNPATTPQLQAHLRDVQALRAYAADTLHLPVGGLYGSYVDLQRPYAVWNVFAAPEFSMRLRTWCYPVAGCVGYRGYFRETAAQNFAARLQAEGMDVFVGGVAAYSTLGWFSDPVLNTFVARPTHRLAALLFHELAHQVVYVKGDTTFNESFATAVEQEGVRRWLLDTQEDEVLRSGVLDAMVRDTRRQADFVSLVQEAVRDLEALYASGETPERLRAAKAVRIGRLRDDYAVLRETWEGYDGYDAWFAAELNNAMLATVATYNELVPAFLALLGARDGDLPRFYQSVRALARLPQVERHAALTRCLTGEQC